MTKIALVPLQAPAVAASGLTGATAASRHVGATASGAPSSGTFAVGDFVIAQNAHVWVCTVAGSPGTWVDTAGAAAVTSVAGRSGAVVLAATDIATNGVLPDTTTALGVQAAQSTSGIPAADALYLKPSSAASSGTQAISAGRLTFYANYWTGTGPATTSAWMGAQVTSIVGFVTMQYNASLHSFTGNVTSTGTMGATNFAPTGLTGATAASRYVGATASGAPASGTFQVGDFAIDQTGVIWVCTVAGSPGTWVKAGSYLLSAANTWTSTNVFNGAITGNNTINLTGAGASSTGGTFSATANISTGLTGATSASRYVGATASGAPASGTFAVGDFSIAQNGRMYVCTSAGSPGTWSAVGDGLPVPNVFPQAGASNILLPYTNISTAAAAAPAQNQACFLPFYVGSALAITALTCNVSTAAIGGTTPVARLGLFNDKGDGSGPGTLIIDGTVTIATTGIRQVATSRTLPPGLYWVGFVFQYSVVPTTLPQFTSMSVVLPLPGPSMSSINYRCLVLAGVSGSFSSNPAATPNSLTAPVLGLLAA